MNAFNCRPTYTFDRTKWSVQVKYRSTTGLVTWTWTLLKSYRGSRGRVCCQGRRYFGGEGGGRGWLEWRCEERHRRTKWLDNEVSDMHRDTKIGSCILDELLLGHHSLEWTDFGLNTCSHPTLIWLQACRDSSICKRPAGSTQREAPRQDWATREL